MPWYTARPMGTPRLQPALVQILIRLAVGAAAVFLGLVGVILVARNVQSEVGSVALSLAIVYAASALVLWAASQRLTTGGILAGALLAAGGMILLWEAMAHVIAPLAIFTLERAIKLVALSDLVFYLLAGLTVAGATGVAFSRNIIYAALSLLFSLLGVAGLYVYLSADFLAITQLLVYVGGILVLILFAIMLTPPVDKEHEFTNPNIALPVGAGLGLITLGALGYMALGTPWRMLPVAEVTYKTTGVMLGDAFLTTYLLPFELGSIVLLGALIGAVVIARKDLKGEPGSAAAPAPGEADAIAREAAARKAA